ncbi:hypothetical protein AMK16_14775 [Streptomyces sp. CB00455]|uniref:SCO2322 family protein n=1 Tax=Streptomyces sp. CB00455 TaxID=1703927 RepID=UPI00093F1E75|nr:SCO2322 family protein [Streptomyces sp. CB00455]OKK19387.1 hypothetical protein AMK16_14775 [Streptomyces sp. CB00455]
MRCRLPVLAVVCGLVLTVLAAAPAPAAGYRYWSFWDGAGGRWAYAAVGPSMARPADGTVQGFRFAVSKDAADQASQPRAAADFEAVCGATAPAQGRKRVAVVIDFGVPADAPAGEAPPQGEPRTGCAQLAPQGTAAEALAAVAKPLRYNGAALLCAVSGYPEQGCGESMAETGPGSPTATAGPAASHAATGGSGAPSAGLLAGAAAVLALAAAAVWQSRRRTR